MEDSSQLASDPSAPSGATVERTDGAVFVNDPIDSDGLPAMQVEQFESLDPNFLRVRLIGDAIFAAIVVVVAIVVAVLVPWWWLPLAIAAGVLLLIGLTAWLQTIEVGHIGYLVRDQDFSFRSGVINRNITTVPFARVQHVSIDRGPLARSFGMATLEMRTAGDGLTVPGISNDTAQRLKAMIVDRAGALAEAEFADDDRDASYRDGPPPEQPATHDV